MRLSLIGSVMIAAVLLGLAPSSASAQDDRYSRCSCSYGWGKECSVKISCYDRGGRCTGPCRQQR